MRISNIELSEVQFAGALSLEIVSIPDVSIFGGGDDESDKMGKAQVAAYWCDVENLFARAFQNSKRFLASCFGKGNYYGLCGDVKRGFLML